MLERELHIERGADVAAHPLAVRYAHGLRSRNGIWGGRWTVDDDPQHPADRLAAQLNVEDLKPGVASDPFSKRTDLLQPVLLTHG